MSTPGGLLHTLVAIVWVSSTSADLSVWDRRDFLRPVDRLPVNPPGVHFTSNLDRHPLGPNKAGAINENILNVQQYVGRGREYFEILQPTTAAPYLRVRARQSCRARLDFRMAVQPEFAAPGSITFVVGRNWTTPALLPTPGLIVLEDEQRMDQGSRVWSSASTEVNFYPGETLGLCYRTNGLTAAGRIYTGNSRGATEISPFTCHFDVTYVGLDY